MSRADPAASSKPLADVPLSWRLPYLLKTGIAPGREAELTHLHDWLSKAWNGERQLVFVTGEAGIGKTTLIEAFLFGGRSYKEVGDHKAQPRTLNPAQPSTRLIKIVDVEG